MSELDDMPVRADWAELRERFVTAVQREFTAYMSTDQPNFDSQLTFAAGRFDEGTGWLRHFCRFAPFVFDRRLNVLDIGAGNGGVAFAFANVRNTEVHTLDLVPNLNLRVVRGSWQCRFIHRSATARSCRTRAAHSTSCSSSTRSSTWHARASWRPR